MTELLHVQIALKAEPEAIYQALTDNLADWFAEHADVSAAEKRYDFWGRFTPGTPTREEGQHPLLAYEAGKHVNFEWRSRSFESIVDIQIIARDGGNTVVVQQGNPNNPSQDIGFSTDEDFWFLSLENLRRHLDGKAPVRCDFSQSMLGDIQHTIEIDAPPSTVFDVLIKPEQMERWIASHATVEAQVGGQYDLGWGQAEKILEFLPDKKLSLEGDYGDLKTVLTWTLEGSGGKTRLTLVHSGFAPDQNTGGLKTGWLNFMSWVKSISEYGDDWRPAIKRIQPGMESYYPASFNIAQSDLITV
ncbi:MAG: SRPBCC family protein [Chloroflexota bacterium]